MNKQALQEIDYYRVRDEVASYCVTQEAKDSFLQREPFTESKQIENLKSIFLLPAKILFYSGSLLPLFLM